VKAKVLGEGERRNKNYVKERSNDHSQTNKGRRRSMK
jgi:hypothetical protein